MAGKLEFSGKGCGEYRRQKRVDLVVVSAWSRCNPSTSVRSSSSSSTMRLWSPRDGSRKGNVLGLWHHASLPPFRLNSLFVFLFPGTAVRSYFRSVSLHLLSHVQYEKRYCDVA